MKQLPLWTTAEESSPIRIEEGVRQEVVEIMAEAIIAIVQATKEKNNEHVEESQGSR